MTSINYVDGDDVCSMSLPKTRIGNGCCYSVTFIFWVAAAILRTEGNWVLLFTYMNVK